MKFHRNFQSFNRSAKVRGYTLVELLVGLAISVFMIGVTLTYLVSSAQSFRIQSNEDMIQENARFALELISRNLRLAGLDPVDIGNVQPMNVIYQGNSCPATGIGATNGTTNTANCSGDAIGINGSDRIAIDYKVGGSGSATLKRTCNDQTVADGTHVASVFWVAQSNAAANMNSLFCQTYNVETGTRIGLGVPILDGVDSIQVQYGVDTDGDGKVNTYQSLTNFNANAAVDAQDVRSIRLALLLNSGISVGSNQTTEVTAERSYAMLDADAIEFEDGVMRQIYSTTVMLPNGL